MNEKIQLLLAQATIGKVEFETGSYYVATQEKMALFAKLLIAETIKELNQDKYIKPKD